MRLIANGTQTGTSLPTPASPTGTPGYAYNNPPGVGANVTILDPDSWNIISAELMSILTAAGVAPDNTGATVNQVLASLRVLGLRTRLAGTATYYVATSGSDSNPGTSGAPFATPQGAMNFLVENVDFNNQAVVVNIAAGTYSGNVVLAGTPPGYGSNSSITFAGNTGAPDSVILSASAGDCVTVSDAVNIVFEGVKFVSTAGNGLSVLFGAEVMFQQVDFGACAASHVNAVGGYAKASGPYEISGAAATHWQSSNGGNITVNGETVTIAGSPAFSSAFASATACGSITATGDTFSGSATGARYSAALNGVINTSGGGASYLPGSSAGATATGGQYA